MVQKAKERPVPEAPKVAPADESMHRALEEGEKRTREYESTLDPRQRPPWFSAKPAGNGSM